MATGLKGDEGPRGRFGRFRRLLCEPYGGFDYDLVDGSIGGRYR